MLREQNKLLFTKRNVAQKVAEKLVDTVRLVSYRNPPISRLCDRLTGKDHARWE